MILVMLSNILVRRDRDYAGEEGGWNYDAPLRRMSLYGLGLNFY